jgi:hypothetical protein
MTNFIFSRGQILASRYDKGCLSDNRLFVARQNCTTVSNIYVLIMWQYNFQSNAIGIFLLVMYVFINLSSESDLFTATRKYGDLGRHEQFCFCSDLMRLLFSESFKRCRLRAGSVINYGPRSGFYYYNMKSPTILYLPKSTAPSDQFQNLIEKL